MNELGGRVLRPFPIRTPGRAERKGKERAQMKACHSLGAGTPRMRGRRGRPGASQLPEARLDIKRKADREGDKALTRP